ncbi:stage V sporulation protein R [Desulfofundulus thermobenzoicus]|uniref:Stage V sporulation protein R n=1 Tax=Desulfofundulus thermobenzoicus TaxID=29376 RepID=A0A6N7INU6_9FIRM|nr:SpoVR family protein [Desulfofundulus thermobenzoicus]MQL51269.1 stage V sporulation protein R [Desulfofundulus thermobenzoicus]
MGVFALTKDELRLLEEAVEKITGKAREFGLDFYDMYFEICPADIIYTFGAYGMPTRFSHWTFGKAYHKMKTQYDYNLSRIYEMVINSDPCYAFLLEGNSLVQNKMVVAHVLAHCDFFKNNVHFSHTPRHMVESMASAAERFRGYELRYGRDKVEAFLDAVISIQEHVDPHHFIKAGRERKKQGKEEMACTCGPEKGCGKHTRKETPYDDLWELDRPKCGGHCEKPKKFPPEPEKDLLLFIMEHARDLDDWQRDIISVIRQEMLYFWPQLETKIMNEGWATYWHLRIIREMDLTEAEALEFAKMHAGVIMPSRMRLNPYHLGLKIFEDIEKRWNEPAGEEREKYGRHGGEGRQKIFEVRELENDISFLRNYLTRELIEEMDLYLYKKTGYDWKITDKEWEKVRDGIVSSLTNGGFPCIMVEDGDFSKRGELYLKHFYEGMELDVFYLERTLPHVYRLWGRPVHLETVVDNKKVLFSYNGEKGSKKFL